MKRKIIWPEGKKFAFTIVDDTDNATLQNIKPVYDYLRDKGFKTTKTCWAFPPKDTEKYSGESLMDKPYAEYLKLLQDNGFEMGFHNAGSGGHTREETQSGFEVFKETFGQHPKMHINHANCIENIYWGHERFKGLIKKIYKKRSSHVKSLGHIEESEYFWGDLCKENIKYIRNRTFNKLNTLKEDPRFVYKESDKLEYSNYWFSSSDAMNIERFKRLVTKKSVDKLVREGGACILYVHFAYGYVDEKGNLDPCFKEMIDYIASLEGYFPTTSELLDFMLADKEYEPSARYEKKMDYKWFVQRIKNR